MSMWMQHPDRSRTGRLLCPCAVLAVLAAVVPFARPCASRRRVRGRCVHRNERRDRRRRHAQRRRCYQRALRARSAAERLEGTRERGHTLTSPPQYPGTAVCQIDGLPQAGFPTCWESNVWWYSHATNPNGAAWTKSGMGAARTCRHPAASRAGSTGASPTRTCSRRRDPGSASQLLPSTRPPRHRPRPSRSRPAAATPGGKPVAPNGGTDPSTPHPHTERNRGSRRKRCVDHDHDRRVRRLRWRDNHQSNERGRQHDEQRQARARRNRSQQHPGQQRHPDRNDRRCAVVLALAAAAAFVAYRRARAA